MRTSQYLLATQKETPADAEVISHQLIAKSWYDQKACLGSIHMVAIWSSCT